MATFEINPTVPDDEPVPKSSNTQVINSVLSQLNSGSVFVNPVRLTSLTGGADLHSIMMASIEQAQRLHTQFFMGPTLFRSGGVIGQDDWASDSSYRANSAATSGFVPFQSDSVSRRYPYGSNGVLLFDETDWPGRTGTPIDSANSFVYSDLKILLEQLGAPPHRADFDVWGIAQPSRTIWDLTRDYFDHTDVRSGVKKYNDPTLFSKAEGEGGELVGVCKYYSPGRTYQENPYGTSEKMRLEMRELGPGDDFINMMSIGSAYDTELNLGTLTASGSYNKGSGNVISVGPSPNTVTLERLDTTKGFYNGANLTIGVTSIGTFDPAEFAVPPTTTPTIYAEDGTVLKQGGEPITLSQEALDAIVPFGGPSAGPIPYHIPLSGSDDSQSQVFTIIEGPTVEGGSNVTTDPALGDVIDLIRAPDELQPTINARYFLDQIARVTQFNNTESKTALQWNPDTTSAPAQLPILGPPQATNPSISPDGTTLAFSGFVWKNDAGGYTGPDHGDGFAANYLHGQGIYTTPIRGTTQALLNPGEQFAGLSHLTANVNTSGSAWGGNRVAIVPGDWGWNNFDPNWSPDGNKIIFTQEMRTDVLHHKQIEDGGDSSDPIIVEGFAFGYMWPHTKERRNETTASYKVPQGMSELYFRIITYPPMFFNEPFDFAKGYNTVDMRSGFREVEFNSGYWGTEFPRIAVMNKDGTDMVDIIGGNTHITDLTQGYYKDLTSDSSWFKPYANNYFHAMGTLSTVYTDHPFCWAPSWSPEGDEILFVSNAQAPINWVPQVYTQHYNPDFVEPDVPDFSGFLGLLINSLPQDTILDLLDQLGIGRPALSYHTLRRLERIAVRDFIEGLNQAEEEITPTDVLSVINKTFPRPVIGTSYAHQAKVHHGQPPQWVSTNTGRVNNYDGEYQETSKYFPNDIFILECDQTDPKANTIDNTIRLTPESGSYGNPVFSPDGTKIAYENWNVSSGDPGPGFIGERSQIWIMDYDKSTRTTSNHRAIVTAGANFRPRWSLDGTKILFSSSREYDDYDTTGGIALGFLASARYRYLVLPVNKLEPWVTNLDGTQQVKLPKEWPERDQFINLKTRDFGMADWSVNRYGGTQIVWQSAARATTYVHNNAFDIFTADLSYQEADSTRIIKYTPNVAGLRFEITGRPSEIPSSNGGALNPIWTSISSDTIDLISNMKAPPANATHNSTSSPVAEHYGIRINAAAFDTNVNKANTAKSVAVQIITEIYEHGMADGFDFGSGISGGSDQGGGSGPSYVYQSSNPRPPSNVVILYKIMGQDFVHSDRAKHGVFATAEAKSLLAMSEQKTTGGVLAHVTSSGFKSVANLVIESSL